MQHRRVTPLASPRAIGLGFTLSLGFTLLETLIALALGAGLLLIAVQAMQTAKQTQALIEQQAELLDNSRAAVHALQSEIAYAGYDDLNADNKLHPTFVFNQASGFKPFEALTASSPSSQGLRIWSIRKGRDCLAQSINSYQFAEKASAYASATASMPTTPPKPRTVQVRPVKAEFYLQTSSVDAASTLYCRGSGNKADQPLARGVEELVFRALQADTWFALDDARVQAALTQAIEVCLVLAANTNVAIGNARVQNTRPTCLRDAAGGFRDHLAKASGDSRLWQRSVAVFPLWNRRG